MDMDLYMYGNIASIAGFILALIGAIIVAVKWLMGYIARTRLKGLEGTWYEYHWTNPDGANAKFKWFDSELKAKAGFFSSYKLIYKNNGELYHGTARYIDKRDDILSGDILLKVQQKKKSTTSKATIYFRYNIPERQIGDNNNEIAGIWLSYNFDKDITSGASILSKNKIPLNELDTKFVEYFDNNKASIVVKRDNTKKNKTNKGKKLWWKFWE